MSQDCDVWFVRHGETDWNAKGLLQGHQDIPLNATGEAQALELKEILSSIPFAAVFSSDLLRARKTAELAIHPRNIPHIIDPSLRERNMGPFEGKKAFEMDLLHKQHFHILDQLPKEEYLSYKFHPELETYSEVYNRVKQYLNKSLIPFKGSSVLVVAHGGVIRSILDYFHFAPGHRWVVANCGYIQFKANQDEWTFSNQQGITQLVIK